MFPMNFDMKDVKISCSGTDFYTMIGRLDPDGEDWITVPDNRLLGIISSLTQIAHAKGLLELAESSILSTPPKRVSAVLGFPSATTFAVTMCNTFVDTCDDEHDGVASFDGDNVVVDVFGNKKIDIQHCQFSEHDLRAMLALLEVSK